MKTTLSFLTLTFLSFVIYTSCNEVTTEMEKDFSFQNAEKIIGEFNAGKLDHEKALIKKGAVEIVSTKNEIVLFVTVKGKQDLMYILQVKPSEMKKELRRTISSAQIIFSRRSLLINSLDEDLKLLFSIDDKMRLDFGEISNENSYKGYGLVQQTSVILKYKTIDDFHGIRTIYDMRKDMDARSNGDDSFFQSTLKCGCCTELETETFCLDLNLLNCDAGGYGALSSSLTVPSKGGFSASCAVTCSSGEPCCNDTLNDEN